jgi:SAM-dependent methyltransferase
MEMAAEPTPSSKVQYLMMQSAIARAIQVAAKLNVADQLADGERDVADLAKVTETHPGALYRLLRLLAGSGIFAETTPGRFKLTPMAECLRTGPHSLRPTVLWQDALSPAREQLLYSVKTGKSAFEKVFGKDIFAWYDEHPDDQRVFNEAMAAHATNTHTALLDAYDFSQFGHIIDVGGGHGAFLSAILRANPGVRGTVFDLPKTIPGAQARMKEQGLTSRCEVVGGDFFQAVPSGGDLYIMSHIIHDWDDQDSIAIIKNIRKAIAPRGKLLLVEMVVPAGNEFSIAKHMDMLMLVISGGKERTEKEYAELYAASGFRLDRVVTTRSPVSGLEGSQV